MANISDVANLANVSVATVSRYLRTPGKVASKSAAKVEMAIRELNYKPNLLARNFSQTRSYTVMVLAPDITNPFLMQVIRGIEDVGFENGYSIILGDIGAPEGRRSTYFELPETRLVDGVIQMLAKLPGNFQERLQSAPVVLLSDCEEDEPYPTVTVDDRGAAEQMTNYLISLGHRTIACLLGARNVKATGKRLLGYRQALENARLAFSDDLLIEGDFSMASGFLAASEVDAMRPRPTAVVCMNDAMAIGLLRGLKQAGYRIPEDISVVGFDDIEFSRYCDPPLTTIRQPAQELGSKAMKTLLQLLDAKDAPEGPLPHFRLPTELIVRESTAVVKPVEPNAE